MDGPAQGPQTTRTVSHTQPLPRHSRDTPRARCHKHVITTHSHESSNPGPQTEAARSYLQVPDLDLRVHGACSENESIRVELRTRESCGEGRGTQGQSPPGRPGAAKAAKAGSLLLPLLTVPAPRPPLRRLCG